MVVAAGFTCFAVVEGAPAGGAAVFLLVVLRGGAVVVGLCG